MELNYILKFICSDVDIEGFFENSPKQVSTQLHQSVVKSNKIIGTKKNCLSLTPRTTPGGSKIKSILVCI